MSRTDGWTDGRTDDILSHNRALRSIAIRWIKTVTILFKVVKPTM